MIDIEFIAQYLLLRHGKAIASRSFGFCAGTIPSALNGLAAAGILEEVAAVELAEAYRFWQRLQGLLRLTQGADTSLADADVSLRPLLARAAGVEQFDAVLKVSTGHGENVMRLYERLIGGPAAEAEHGT